MSLPIALAAAGGAHLFVSRSPHSDHHEASGSARVSVRGKVVSDTERQPLANARVVFHPMPETEMSARSAPDWEQARSSFVEAATDESGRYSVALPRAGRYSMSVFVDGKAPSTRQVELRSARTLDAELSAIGFDLGLTLRDDTQRPIAHAEVFYFSYAGQLLARGTTDAQGLIRQRLPGGIVYIGVSASGHASLLDRRLLLADEEVEMVSSRARPAEVRVRDGERPVPGARVVLLDAFGFIAAAGSTDASGNFQVSHLHLGEYKVWAAAGTRVGETSTSLVPGRENASVLVPLEPANTSSVDLLVDADCTPDVTTAARAYGDVVWRTKVAPVLAMTPSGQRLSLDLPPAEQRILVVCGDRAARLEYSPSAKRVPEVAFHPLLTARGRVRAPDGSALSAAAVTYQPSEGAPWTLHGLTNENGDFTLTGLPGGRGVVTAYHPSYGATSVPVPASGTPEPLELRFEPKHFVEGRIETEAGKPLAGARVALSTASGAGVSVTSNLDGSFRLGPLVEQRGLLLVFDGGRPVQDRPLLVTPEQSSGLAVVVPQPQ